jgi:hypothetical protein
VNGAQADDQTRQPEGKTQTAKPGERLAGLSIRKSFGRTAKPSLGKFVESLNASQLELYGSTQFP